MLYKMSSSNRIARNTIFLFFRTLFILGVSLYTSRIVLYVLGEVDYGIYNVVAGIVAMLAFLNSAMVQASQRYLCIAQGKDEALEEKKQIFSTSFYIHLTIALLVCLILETLGLWYVNNILVLPVDKIFAANVIYQFSIGIFILRIMIVPYTSSVVAREHFHVYAYVSIIDAVLQLVGILLLEKTNINKLIVYVLILLIIAGLNYIFYFVYCRIKYKECRIVLIKNLNLYKEMFKYSSWAFLGGFGFVARTQGVNLVLNYFCGPVINAARGLATQVSSAVQTLVFSFQQAINPQIIKRYAQNEPEGMFRLIHFGSKYSFLMLSIIFTPILIRPSYILSLWLLNIPEYTSAFLIMGIIMCLIISITSPLTTAIQATGDIKQFQILVSVIMCFDIPFSYLLLSLGIVPWLVTIVSIFTSIGCLMVELWLLNKLIGFNVYEFIKFVLIKCLLVILFAYPIVLFLSKIFPDNFVGLVGLCLIDVLVYVVVIYICAINKTEREYIISYIRNYIKISD